MLRPQQLRLWEEVFFTDESSVWLYPTFTKKWTKKIETPVLERPKHCPKFHMWGRVLSRGATPLCIFDNNLTKQLFVDILQGFPLPAAQVLYENDWWLQQDNDPKHTVGYTKQWLRNKKLACVGVAIVQFWSKSDEKHLETHIISNCTKKQSQMLKKWSESVQKCATLWRTISYKLRH